MFAKKSPFFASAFLGATLLLPTRGTAQALNLQHATAADLEKDGDETLRAFTAYVNTVRIPELAKTDPALANALKICFNEILPGEDHVTRGEIDFEVMMAKLEQKVAKDHTEMSGYSALKLADMSFNQTMKTQQKLRRLSP